MKNKLLEALKSENNYTKTENDAITHKSTLNACLDFFGVCGALRTRNENEIISIFIKAYSEDPLTALKILFYLRDIRGGLGERRTFRIITSYLARTFLSIVSNFDNFIKFGRWDDLLELVYDPKIGNSVKRPIILKIKEQLFKDLTSDKPSLLAKWMPSENAGKKSKIKAKYWIKELHVTPADYRKSLSKIRKKLDIVERKICKKQWDEIDYSKVPSGASLKYSNQFKIHDNIRYDEFLDNVVKGETKINTKTLFPYEILRKIMDGYDEKALTVMWDNLPNYCEEGGENSIVVCDTSGSMFGNPLDVAISLSMYFAERNKGIWKNHFITFSNWPEFQEIFGNTLKEKYNNLSNAKWTMNTDLQKVFELILSIAKNYNIPESDMLRKIYIISDMEFDYCVKGKTNFESIKNRFSEAGYIMPTLIFWNVESRNNQMPITIKDNNVYLVSGSSPSIFKNLMKTEAHNAEKLMMEILNSERYDSVKII